MGLHHSLYKIVQLDHQKIGIVKMGFISEDKSVNPASICKSRKNYYYLDFQKSIKKNFRIISNPTIIKSFMNRHKFKNTILFSIN